MPHEYSLVSEFLNLFTPSPLTVARRQHPTYPPTPTRRDDIIAAAALSVTPRPTVGLQQPLVKFNTPMSSKAT